MPAFHAVYKFALQAEPKKTRLELKKASKKAILLKKIMMKLEC